MEYGRETVIRLTEYEFEEIVQYFRANYGINLQKKKVLVECRMAKELERLKVPSFAEYLRLLRRDRTGDVAAGMVNQLTTNYTYFLREPAHFSLLEQKIYPELFPRKYGPCQIWCAGCATGEECYTLAMSLCDYRESSGMAVNARILATDISEEVLKRAEKGIYPKKEKEWLPVSWQEKYCVDMDAGHFCVEEYLKYHIRFLKHNLLAPLPEKQQFDVIFCRNVMIYFDKTVREQLVRRLEDCLKEGGYLFTGHAELLSREETRLEQVYPAVYRKARTSE